MTIEIASRLRDEVCAYIRAKAEENVPMEFVAIALIEAGCAAAFMRGISPDELMKTFPQMAERGRKMFAAVIASR